MVETSVIVCTHNPRPDYFSRVLAALHAQTLAEDLWELIVIDNASQPALNDEWISSWQSSARLLREEELGLTAARLRGIAEAAGDLLVFVDDDNVLDKNYLEAALRIARDYSFVGAWGGSIRAEFENEPGEDIRAVLGYLGIRTVAKPIWSNNPRDARSHPCGAGLCVRAIVARAYAAQLERDPARRTLGRVGAALSSGEDIDLAFTSCDLGMGFGNFPQLTLIHLIPKHRLRWEYLNRLAEGILSSGVVLRYLRYGEMPPRASRLQDAAWYLMKFLTEGRRQAQIYLAGKRGVRRGMEALERLRAANANHDVEDLDAERHFTDAPAPLVSIVIPTYQRQRPLATCLARLAKCQGSQRAEIIVVDQTPAGCAVTDLVGVPLHFSALRRIALVPPNVSAARNLGAVLARAPVILFLDDDIEPETDYLKILALSLFERRRVDVVGGDFVDSFSDGMALDASHEAAAWLPTGNLAMRREDFLAVGGFDENLYRYNEDAELSHRLRQRGLKLERYHGLRVIHHREPAGGGTRYHGSVLQAARMMLCNDLYFIRAIGGGWAQAARCALRTLVREGRGYGKIRSGSPVLRLSACCAMLPSAIGYTFRTPRLLSGDRTSAEPIRRSGSKQVGLEASR